MHAALALWLVPLQVAFICHVPKKLQEEKADSGFSIKEWVEAVCKAANAGRTAAVEPLKP